MSSDWCMGVVLDRSVCLPQWIRQVSERVHDAIICGRGDGKPSHASVGVELGVRLTERGGRGNWMSLRESLTWEKKRSREFGREGNGKGG